MAAGLNPFDRGEQRRIARAAEAQPQPLDPPFPYGFREFDPDFFGIPANPERQEEGEA